MDLPEAEDIKKSLQEYTEESRFTYNQFTILITYVLLFYWEIRSEIIFATFFFIIGRLSLSY